MDIPETHIFKASMPPSWPSQGELNQLKYKSSEQFIYVATVVRYVRHRPQQRLDAILGLRPPFKDLLFSELDALYLHFLGSKNDPFLAADIMVSLPSYHEKISPEIGKLHVAFLRDYKVVVDAF